MVSHLFFYQLARQPEQPIYAGCPPQSQECHALVGQASSSVPSTCHVLHGAMRGV